MARVILAEPWFGGSHRAWAEGLAIHSSHDIAVVGLEPTLWRWRLRAGAAPLADAIASEIVERGEPDLLLVSGLVDVAALLGHLRPSPDLPVVTYMHETQLIYPTASVAPDPDVTFRNWESWLASDQVWFNSAFHRDAVVEALPAWAASQPEPLPIDEISGSFHVVPVGVEPPAGVRLPSEGSPIILWPHRWEPDKAPEVFRRALSKLADAGLDFRLVLAGEDPAGSPDREVIIDEHADRLLAAGPFERAEYERWLHAADLVVSCANHEFFGIAVVEALMAGCVPVLPAALSYPELIPPELHDAALYPVGTFGTRLADAVANLAERRLATVDLADAMQRFAWPTVIVDYDMRITAMTCEGHAIVTSLVTGS
mgnify:CR=1 FL=1